MRIGKCFLCGGRDTDNTEIGTVLAQASMGSSVFYFFLFIRINMVLVDERPKL